MVTDAIVVGGGVIGLTAAWVAAGRGLDTVVVDPAPGQGASWVAAGMLAPVTEATFGEGALVALLVAGADRWPVFANRLGAAAGVDIGYRASGTIAVAVDTG
ncbi:MAG TPA: FAD-dependent oxidoreductase, partial [Acidimicrobiales bacterium]